MSMVLTCTISWQNNLLAPRPKELLVHPGVESDGSNGEVVHVGQHRGVGTVWRPILK